jgi:hypothetical protein
MIKAFVWAAIGLTLGAIGMRYAVIWAYERDVAARGLRIRRTLERAARGDDPRGNLIPPVLAQDMLGLFNAMEEVANARQEIPDEN